MIATIVDKNEVLALIARRKRVNTIRRKLTNLFTQAEALRAELMWQENPTGITTSWAELKNQLNGAK